MSRRLNERKKNKTLRVLFVGHDGTLGASLIHELASQKSKIIIVHEKGQKPIEEEEIKSLGAEEVLKKKINFSNIAHWKRISKAIKQFGGIDYFIYIHSIFEETQYDYQIHQKIMQTNFTNFVVALKILLPQLRKNKSQIAILGPPTEQDVEVNGNCAYMASKRAIELFALSIREKEKNIGVTCIYPPKILENSPKTEPEFSITSEVTKAMLKDILAKEEEFYFTQNPDSRRRSLSQHAGNLGIFSTGISSIEPPPIEHESTSIFPPLVQCIYQRDRVAIKEMLKYSKEGAIDQILAQEEITGRCSIHYACYFGLADVVSTLLRVNRTKIISVVDKFQWTPLHFAASGGHLSLIKKLLDDSADPNALTNSGMSAFHFVARLNPGNDPKVEASFQKILRKLTQLGADINQRNKNWVTPLHQAVLYKSIPAVSFIINHDGDVHRKTKNHETPLHFAMVPDNEKIIKILLKAKADPIGCFDIAPTSYLPLLEKYREKNRRPVTDFDIAEKPAIYISKIDDFPRDAMHLLEKSGLLNDKELLYEHWNVLLMVLRFLLHKRFKDGNEKKARDERRAARKRRIKTDLEDSSMESGGEHSERNQTETNVEDSEKKEKLETSERNAVQQKHCSVTRKRRKTYSSRTNHGMNLEEASNKFISNGNPTKLFKLGDQVGRGGFGTVFTAKKISDRSTVAIKKVSHHTEKEKWGNFDEIYYLDTLRLPRIVSYQNAYAYRDELWITMEYLAGGSLQEMLEFGKRFEEKHIAFVMKHALKGLEFIHSKNCIHRDLKSANIMIGEHARVFLIDFGLCCPGDYPKISMVGSPFWMPPEMIRGERQSIASDIWSLGIVAIEMAEKEPPNRRSALTAMFYAGIGRVPKLEDESRWSDAFKNFLARMLVSNPEERATAEELLDDPWFDCIESDFQMSQFFQHIFVEKSLETLLG